MRKTVKIFLTFSVVLVILASMIGMIAVLVHQGSKGTQSPVYSNRLIEAGSEFDPAIFLRDPKAHFVISESSFYDVNKPGDYTLLLIMNDGTERTVILKVRDTTVPVVEPLPVFLVKKGSGVLPEDLVPQEYVKDVSPVKASFLSGNVSTAKEGLFEISLRVEDQSGNSLRVEVSYFVTDDINSGYVHEIGGPLPTAEDLLPGCSAVFTEELAKPVVPGKVLLKVRVFDADYVMYYSAADTVAPVGQVKNEVYNFYVGDSLPDAADFFESITDETEVTVSYEREYLLDKAEQKRIKLILEDLGGNKSEYELTISVFEKNEGEDLQAPVISGYSDIETTLGVAPDYLAGITVYDGRDGIISLDKVTVDSSAVKLNVISTGAGYPVIYTVSDAAGNKTVITVHVKVVRPPVSEEQIEECFDEVMKHIKTEGLSRFSILSLVYDYITSTYRFSSDGANTDGTDYRVEAYWGFKLKNGNHETYTAMTSVIFDRLDIAYYKVNRQKQGSVPHSWMLVDYGVGWLYMDCSPLEGFVWTKDGKLYTTDDPAVSALDPSEIRDRSAMTDGDIKQLTDLLNTFERGWNYYKADVSGGLLPKTATKNEQGGYDSPSYTITYVTDSPNGKISGTAVQVVKHGVKTAAVTAEAVNPGYRFVRWSDGVTEATRSDIAMKNTTITAEFELFIIDKHTVTYTATEGGTISGTTVQTKRYNETTATVTAKPLPGYCFIGWEDGVKTASRSDKVTRDVEYKALFAPLVQLEYLAEEGGTIEGEAKQTLNPGELGEIVTAVPNKGYVFVAWSDGTDTAQRRDTESITVTALFAKDETSTYTAEYLAGEGGFVDGQTSQSVICWQQTTAVTAQAFAGYRFVSWSDGQTEATRTDILIENLTVSAVFEKLPFYELKYQAGLGGTVEGLLAQTLYDGQQGQEVVAVPDEGYEFVGWDDGVTNAARTDTVAENKTFTAIFKEIEKPKYTLTYQVDMGGRLEGEVFQTVTEGEMGSAVTAVADEGYVFISWSDGKTEPTRTDVALQDETFEAFFGVATE